MLIRDKIARAERSGASDFHEQTVARLRLYWASRKFLLRTAGLAFIVSALITLSIPVRYQSVTGLMPPDNLALTGNAFSALAQRTSVSGGLADLASGLLGAKSSGALFVGIIESQTVRDRLIERFDLKKVYRDSNIEDARADLAQRTSVSENSKSGIISIAVTDHDPKRAASMAQTYVEELDRLVAQLATSSARRERIFLEGRLKDVKKEVDNSARNFSDFASKNSAIDIPAQGKAMLEATARLQGELIAAQSDLEGLKQIYTNDNVRVRSARARVDELRKKLDEMGTAGTGGDADAKPDLYPSIRKLPILGVTYADLYQQTKIEETVYELLTEQYELAKVEEAREIPSVKVLDAAMVPTKKTYPPRTLFTLVGTFLALAGAVVWIAAMAGWQQVKANDLRKQFAMEVLTDMRASLPSFLLRSANGGSNGHRSRSLWKKTAGWCDSDNEESNREA